MAQYTHKDVTHFLVKQRKIEEGGHGIIYSANLRFSDGKTKKVAAKRYKSAYEAVGQAAVLKIDTLNTRPFNTAHNMFFRLKVGDPRSEQKVRKIREMIKDLRLGGCAIAKMDFIQHEGEYWLVSPLFERGGKSILGEDYEKTNLEERKLVWGDVAKMINSGYYTRKVEDSYFFLQTRLGKKPIIIDIDQIMRTDKKGSFFPYILKQLIHPAEQKTQLALALYSRLTSKNKKLFLGNCPPDIFESITGRKRRTLTIAQEINLFEKNRERRNNR